MPESAIPAAAAPDWIDQSTELALTLIGTCEQHAADSAKAVEGLIVALAAFIASGAREGHDPERLTVAVVGLLNVAVGEMLEEERDA